MAAFYTSSWSQETKGYTHLLSLEWEFTMSSCNESMVQNKGWARIKGSENMGILFEKQSLEIYCI